MFVIRGLVNLVPFIDGCVVTIGNFDGVHLGHRAVIQKLAEKGKQLGLPVVVVLFEPQPLEYFLQEKAPSRLTRLREKLVKLRELPVDYVLVLKFDKAFSILEPEDFLQYVLVDKLRTKHLVVGDDFRFGTQRRGDFQLLCELAPKYGFDVVDTKPIFVNQNRVSSTLIRQALDAGDLAVAQKLLGRPYSVCGRIVHGAKRGQSIGFPTANIRMLRKNTAIKGVFAVTMTGFNAREIHGVANVGKRPTVDAENAVLLETHLFEFDGDLYGHAVEVHFHKKIRNEVKFATLDELKKQIRNDVRVAQEFFAQPGHIG